MGKEIFFNLDTCIIDEDETKVICLGKDGEYYTFPIPQRIDIAECDPCLIKKLNQRLLAR